MKKIQGLFKQLHALLDEEMDLKTYQEFYILAERLLYHINDQHRYAQQEWKESVEFFQDANISIPFSFGQCGNHVYWKVVDRVLYISGSGPMWDFENIDVDFTKKGVSSPWQNTDYEVVMIGHGVTSIGSESFNCAQISNIIIPSSVKTIKTMAFFNAKIETLILPETIETLEEQILSGFTRIADTVIVSANIVNIRPFAFFNRNDIVANTIVLTGTLPLDLKPMVDSCLFDDVGRYKIYYPEEWDNAKESFIEKLLPKFPDSDGTFLQNLKKALIPYKMP